MRHGKKYKDVKAAIEVGGCPNGVKKRLTGSPFIRQFEYGANLEGYWNYQHFVLQVEDCVDVLNYLFPCYEVLLLVDHSCGHDRQREDGLNVENMIRGYGGSQSKMRDTTIKKEEGYLGPFKRQLEPGAIQSMVFKATDEGPFWMSPEEREEKRHDREVEGQTKTKKLNKRELALKLQEKGIRTKGTAKELVKLAEDNGIATAITCAKIVEGWEGKPKGMLQVLWERGWIDETNLKHYSIKGRHDACGLLIKGSSLKILMSSCEDFEEEESLLQAMGREMGITVDRTPKCHCELAGEGIEYAWGCSKNFYRSLHLNDKRGKENFRSCVEKSLSPEVLTTARIRKFARRARQYICAYYMIYTESKKNETAAENTHLHFSDRTTPVKLEQLVKKFKTHRCAMDFDSKFCKASFREEA
jgi:hypothetical protein